MFYNVENGADFSDNGASWDKLRRITWADRRDIWELWDIWWKKWSLYYWSMRRYMKENGADNRYIGAWGGIWRTMEHEEVYEG